jgi:hypothetical protein
MTGARKRLEAGQGLRNSSGQPAPAEPSWGEHELRFRLRELARDRGLSLRAFYLIDIRWDPTVSTVLMEFGVPFDPDRRLWVDLLADGRCEIEQRVCNMEDSTPLRLNSDSEIFIRFDNRLRICVLEPPAAHKLLYEALLDETGKSIVDRPEIVAYVNRVRRTILEQHKKGPP